MTQASPGDVSTPPGPKESPRQPRFALGRWQLLSLALSSTWSTHFFGWQDPPPLGFEGSHMVGLVVVIAAYWCMNTCSNAIFQVIQFSGGAYGLARVSLGFYTGFLVAAAEWLEYTMQMSHATLLFANLVTPTLASSPMSSFTLQLLVWLVLTSAAVSVHTGPPAIGSRLFIVGGLALVPLMGVVLLIFTTTSSAFALTTAQSMPPNLVDTLGLMPHLCWHFIGVDSLHLCCDDVDDSELVIPSVKSRTLAILSASATAGVAFVLACSPLPPITPSLVYPMLTFLPAALLVLSWLFNASRILRAMAASRLVSKRLRHRLFAHRAPVLPLVLCGLASLMSAIIVTFVPSFDPLALAIACALLRQMAQCLGFLYLHRYFKHVADSLRNTRHVVLAVAALIVWLVAFGALLALAPNGATTAIVLGVLLSAATLYYFLHVKSAQKFSDAERKSLMFAHVILFNKNKSKQMQRRCRRESLAARRKSVTGVSSTPPASARLAAQLPPTPDIPRPIIRPRRNSTIESNFIVRDGKIIPIPATSTSPTMEAANKGRRKSSAHSIELSTLD